MLFFFLITPLVAAAEAVSLAPCAIYCPMGPWGSCRRRSLPGPSCSRSPGAEGPSVKMLEKKERTNACICFFIYLEFYCYSTANVQIQHQNVNSKRSKHFLAQENNSTSLATNCFTSSSVSSLPLALATKATGISPISGSTCFPQ